MYLPLLLPFLLTSGYALPFPASSPPNEIQKASPQHEKQAESSPPHPVKPKHEVEKSMDARGKHLTDRLQGHEDRFAEQKKLHKEYVKQQRLQALQGSKDYAAEDRYPDRMHLYQQHLREQHFERASGKAPYMDRYGHHSAYPPPPHWTHPEAGPSKPSSPSNKIQGSVSTKLQKMKQKVKDKKNKVNQKIEEEIDSTLDAAAKGSAYDNRRNHNSYYYTTYGGGSGRSSSSSSSNHSSPRSNSGSGRFKLGGSGSHSGKWNFFGGSGRRDSSDDEGNKSRRDRFVEGLMGGATGGMIGDAPVLPDGEGGGRTSIAKAGAKWLCGLGGCGGDDNGSTSHHIDLSAVTEAIPDPAPVVEAVGKGCEAALGACGEMVGCFGSCCGAVAEAALGSLCS